MKKLLLIFTFSAMTGILILGFLFFADYMTGPDLTLHNVTIELNEEVNAWSFVTECSEKDASVRFVTEPDFTVPGGQEIEIEAVDSKGKSTVKKAMLKVTILKRNLSLEADGTDISLSEILVQGIDAEQTAFKYKAVKKDHVGTVDVVVIYQGVEYDGEINLVDTQAPQVTLKDTVVAWQNHEFDVMSAAAEITDATEVTAEYKGMLDTSAEGEYPLTFVFTDAGGNQTELVKNVQVIRDTVPPVISGAVDREYAPGVNISYLDGVSAMDEIDGNCEIFVDNSQVLTDTEGSYPVTYRTKDLSGNESGVTVNFTIRKLSADEERMNAKADEVLAGITDESMSLSAKAYAIYNYAYANIAYTGTSDKSDWVSEAWRGMTELNGDCFTYASVCKALLQRIGVQTMDVKRVGGQAEHYWLLVNLGSGWYHFDATRRSVYFDGFMARDEDVQAYTAQVGGNYYTFDNSAYPATPTEKFKME